MGITINAATGLDRLFIQLLQPLKTQPLEPLKTETIIVQSQGLRRWLTLRLADELPCVASIDMPFPGTFCRTLAGELGTELSPEDDLYDRDCIHWRLFSLLGRDDILSAPEAKPLANYLKNGNCLLRWQLARQLAGVFDNYQLYRPSLLDTWKLPGGAESEHLGWQHMLWRAISDMSGDADSFDQRYAALKKALDSRTLTNRELPSRIHIFGINSIAPTFLELLIALQSLTNVCFYLLSPTARISDEIAEQDDNPLVDALGSQSRTLFAQIRELAPATNILWDEFVETDDEGETILIHLQRDIQQRRVQVGRGAAPGIDHSLQINNCHSPMREMEILRDQLLDAFAGIADLQPEDVAVLVPSIEEYAPYIDAVFGVNPQGIPEIPYRMADHSVACQDPTLQAFLQFLALPDSRMTPGDILPLLEANAVRRMTGIDEEDIPAVRSMVEQAHIYWGVDEHDRKDIGELPRDSDVQSYRRINTWRQGLESMLLSYMVGRTIESTPIINGIAAEPFQHLGDNRLLGRLCNWLNMLFAEVKSWDTPRPLHEWVAVLDHMITDFFSARGQEECAGLALIQKAISRLRGHVSLLPELKTELLPLNMVKDSLEQLLDSDGFGSPFFTGAVTFCSLKPMRSIPFKVLAICGLQNGVFPRRDQGIAFDLITQFPQTGDRNLREDDRQMFLEQILAASERLILSYVGQSQRDNSFIAPSPCIAEMSDYLVQAFGSEFAETIILKHRLHPFSRAYYEQSGDARLFSHISEYCPPEKIGDEQERLLNDPVNVSENSLTIHDLSKAFSSAPEFYCNHVLRVYFDAYRDATKKQSYGNAKTDETQLEGHELLSLNSLSASILKQDILSSIEQDGTAHRPSELYTQFALRGSLPPAGFGRREFDSTYDEVLAFYNRIPPVTRHDPVTVDYHIGEWHLTGKLDSLVDTGRVQYRCASLKPKDYLRAWIQHVFLNILVEDKTLQIDRQTLLIGEDKAETFSPVEDAMALLEELLKYYKEILCRPQPLFEKASFTYGKAGLAQEGYEKASKIWRSDDSTNPYVVRCFGEMDSLDPLRKEFEEWSCMLWAPCWQSIERDKK